MERFRQGVTLEQLEKTAAKGCQAPGCTQHGSHPLVLHANCHRGKGVDVIYRQGEGYVEIVCHQCKELVAAVQVASRFDEQRAAAEHEPWCESIAKECNCGASS